MKIKIGIEFAYSTWTETAIAIVQYLCVLIFIRTTCIVIESSITTYRLLIIFFNLVFFACCIKWKVNR